MSGLATVRVSCRVRNLSQSIFLVRQKEFIRKMAGWAWEIGLGRVIYLIKIASLDHMRWHVALCENFALALARSGEHTVKAKYLGLKNYLTTFLQRHIRPIKIRDG